jgi:hypothetical protein
MAVKPLSGKNLRRTEAPISCIGLPARIINPCTRVYGYKKNIAKPWADFNGFFKCIFEQEQETGEAGLSLNRL